MSRGRDRFARLPLRRRLVAGFVVALSVVLIAAGSFVYWRVQHALDSDLDAEIGQAAQTITPLIGPDGQVRQRSTAEATGAVWQVIDARGAVLDHGSLAGTEALVDADELEHITRSGRIYDVRHFLPVSDDPYWVQVSRTAPSQYLVVGVRRAHRDEALRELLLQLSLAGLGTLLITSFVGDRLARAALRPVERYRRRAATIAEGNPGLRLDVPAGRDDEITRLGDTFNEMLATLEGALERERRFVSEASHELRTPITLLTSRVQLAQRRARTPEEHERILAELAVDLARLAALTEDLLTLGRLEARPEAVESSDLVAATERVVEQRRMADPTRAEDLLASVPTSPLHPLRIPLADVEADRLVGNLLTNAATHGATPIEVTVEQPEGGWARLTVTDAGPGMSPALLEKAPLRFVRAPEARSLPGSGLGLSLVAGLVDRAGGELRLCHDGDHSRHGARAPVACTHGPAMTVTVLLPVADG